MKQRAAALGLSVLSFAACIWIALAHPGPFVRGTLGDVLIVIFLYFLVQTLRRFNRTALAGTVFLFALCVELLQALGISSWLGLKRGGTADTIVGSTFDWKDCIAYAAGVLTAWILDGLIEAKAANAKPEK